MMKRTSLVFLVLLWSVELTLIPLQAQAHGRETRYVPCSQTLLQQVSQADATEKGYHLQVQLWASMDRDEPTRYCGTEAAQALLWVPPHQRTFDAYCVWLTTGSGNACWTMALQPLTAGGPYRLETPAEVMSQASAAEASMSNGQTDQTGVALDPRTALFPQPTPPLVDL